MKISIDGNIGCGKTTVIQKINDKMRIPIFLEPLHKWHDLLQLFYENPQKWAFPFNLEVMTSFHEWKNNTFPAIYERSPLSCRHVFTELNHANGHLHKLELQIFDKIFKELSWNPDVLIYIKTDPSICMKRMQERGRQCEQGVSSEYIQAIHDKYEQLVSEINSNIHLHVVDGNQNKEKVVDDVKNIINLYIQ